MKSLYYFIVKPFESRYDNIREVNGNDLIINTGIEDHKFISKKAVVVSTPAAYATKINIGDELYVHHNIFRRFRDIKGKEKNSKNYLSEDVYLVQPDQIYAYKRNGKWKALEGFVFVMPIKETKIFSLENERPLIGIVKYSNGDFEKNQLIGFRPNSEYEFIIDGQRLYRVPTNSITIKYEYQGNEEEYNPSWAQSS